MIEISGPTSYSSLDESAALETALGKPIASVAVARDRWVDVIAQNGMPANRSGAYIELVDGINSGWMHHGAQN